MKKILLALLFCVSGTAIANSACDVPRNNFDGLYCLNKVFHEADKELNKNYQTLKSQLDDSGKKALKSGQLSWMKERNNSCSRVDGTSFFVDLNCATKTTIKRSQFLQDRIRECASSGCKNSQL